MSLRSLPKTLLGMFRLAPSMSRDERLIASSGLFDESWYVANNPEAARFPGGALHHFLQKGARELRDPNPWFKIAWYCKNHPRLNPKRLNPLVHYLRRGSAEGARPSPEFDPAWYRSAYPDVPLAGFEPLVHYLRIGRAEGRRPKASDEFRPVEAAPLEIVKAPAPRETTALFVTYAPRGRVKPHVGPLLGALRDQGFPATLIVAADDIHSVETAGLAGGVDGLLVRQNEGYDFAAWARCARAFDFARARILCLVNDSVIGPLGDVAFAGMFDRIHASGAHLLGLTDSLQITPHLQSYFLVARAEGVSALVDFLAGVKAFRHKEDVIINYEVPLLRYFRERGLSAEALFPSSAPGDAGIEQWRDLIARGFPFVKVAALRRTAEDWRGVLRSQGYDVRIAEETLAMTEEGEAGRSVSDRHDNFSRPPD